MVGVADTPAPVPEPWVPPSSAPKKPASPSVSVSFRDFGRLSPLLKEGLCLGGGFALIPSTLTALQLKPEAWTPPAGPSAPQVQAEEKAEVPRSAEAAEKEEGDPEEAAGEERAPLAHEGPKERLQKERPRKERPRKERQRTEERPWKPEKPRPAREPRESLPQRWKAREEGHRPWVRDSRDPKHRKRQAWASPRRPSAGDWLPGRQKYRAGKGRD